jgi:hypothetical protein
MPTMERITCNVRRFVLARPLCVMPTRHFGGVDYKNCANCQIAKNNLYAKVRKEQAEITKEPTAAHINELYVVYQARNGKKYKYSIISGESHLQEIEEVTISEPSDSRPFRFSNN